MGQVSKRGVSCARIAEENAYQLRRYHQFRQAADAVAAAWRKHPDVLAVALIGSLAVRPFKEVPRFSPYRRAGIALWHECKDIDLALWLTDTRDLNGLRRTKNRALRELFENGGPSVASHQTDVFILEPATDRYLGRLCEFKTCPKAKPECLVPGCGATAFLQQHQDFRFRPDTLAADRMVRLFDRATGQVNHAAEALR